VKSFENRFRHHIGKGLRIDVALDIGAFRGEFSRLLEALWPGVTTWQFEADERQQPRNPDAHYMLLGNTQREVDFYTVDEAVAWTTGSSIYRENTEFYRDPLILKKQMTTIDTLMETMDFSGDWKAHGLVKIDTQGSELDILDGARGFFTRFAPRVVLLEVSVIPYNAGAPLMADVVAYMTRINYRPLDIFDLQYWPDGTLIQMDVLFESIPQ
jgi:FkbM family methyltransferase